MWLLLEERNGAWCEVIGAGQFETEEEAIAWADDNLNIASLLVAEVRFI